MRYAMIILEALRLLGALVRRHDDEPDAAADGERKRPRKRRQARPKRRGLRFNRSHKAE